MAYVKRPLAAGSALARRVTIDPRQRRTEEQGPSPSDRHEYPWGRAESEDRDSGCEGGQSPQDEYAKRMPNRARHQLHKTMINASRAIGAPHTNPMPMPSLTRSVR